MATLKEAQGITEKFTNEFFNLKGVYGTGTMVCDCCNKPYIHVLLDKNVDKNVLNKIPNNYQGLKVVKEFGDMPVAQKIMVDVVKKPIAFESKETDKDKFKKSFEGKDNYIISLTKKGLNAIMKAPITGGYVPEDIGILLDVQNQNKTIGELKQSPRKYENLEGLLIYLHTKGLIAINGITSPNANDFSNADGGNDFSEAGGRRRSAPRRSVTPRRSWRASNQGGARRHVNYIRRNYNRFYNVPYAVTPVYYVYDVQNPKRIVITKKGLEYIKRHNKGAYPYFLSAIKTGNVYNEVTLKNSLKLGDWNRVVSYLYGNKLIDFV